MHDSTIRPLRADRVRRSLVAAGLGTIGTAWGVPARAQAPKQTIRIGRTDYLSPLSEIEERVLSEAFRRIGIACEFVRLPLLRLIEMASDGSVDGDIGRIPEVAARYPNLLMVPTPICRVEVAIYGGAPDFARRTRAEIAKMSIGIVRGVFVLSKYTQGMNVIEVQNFEAITNMLSNRRIDAAMTVYLDTAIQLQQRQIPEMVRWPYLWAAEPLHCLLHNKHAAVASKLDAELLRMAKEGLIERSYREVLKKIGVQPLGPADAAPR